MSRRRRLTAARARRLPFAAQSVGSAAAPSTPITIITDATVAQWFRADLGIHQATGVDVWSDQTANGRHLTQGTGGAQPLYTASDATLLNRPTITFDGIAQFLVSTWTRPAPATTNTWMWAIIKQVASASGRNIFSDKLASKFIVRQTATSPNLLAFGTSGGNTNGALAIGSWGRLETAYTGSTADYLKLKATKVTGASGGAFGAGTGTVVGTDAVAAAFANCVIAELVVCLGIPSAGVIANLDAYGAALYGASLF